MKKLLIVFALLIGAVSANANSLTINNHTACSYNISTQGGYIYVPAFYLGMFFPSPAAVSGGSGATTFTSAKIVAFGETAQLNIMAILPGCPTFVMYSSATVGSFPACLSGSPYKADWSVTSTCDILISIHL